MEKGIEKKGVPFQVEMANARIAPFSGLGFDFAKQVAEAEGLALRKFPEKVQQQDVEDENR